MAILSVEIVYTILHRVKSIALNFPVLLVKWVERPELSKIISGFSNSFSIFFSWLSSL